MAHAGWAWAGGSPYQATKLVASHFGGTWQPMAVPWPDGIKPDAGVEGRKPTQYFEIYASRGIYHEGWYAGAFGPRIPWLPGAPEGFAEWTPDKDRWELYDLEQDWSQPNDPAEEMPEKLAEMKEIFLAEAERNKVLPIGGAFWSTAAMHPEDAPSKPTSEWDFPGRITRIPEFTAPRLGNTPNVVTIDVDAPERANGVLYVIGPYAGGMSLFLIDGILTYEYNLFLMERPSTS